MLYLKNSLPFTLPQSHRIFCLLRSSKFFGLVNSDWSFSCQPKQTTHVSQQKEYLKCLNSILFTILRYTFCIFQLSFTAQVLEFVKRHVSWTYVPNGELGAIFGRRGIMEVIQMHERFVHPRAALGVTPLQMTP